MLLKRSGSKWMVLGDDGRRCYRTYKNRRDADRFVEYEHLCRHLSSPASKWPLGLLDRIRELGELLGEKTYDGLTNISNG